MSGMLAFMIMVSCSDGLQDCRIAEDALASYPTVEQCETALIPSVERASRRGQKIYGRCIIADADVMTPDVSLYWRIDKKGDFYVEVHDEDLGSQSTGILNVSLKQLAMPAA